MSFPASFFKAYDIRGRVTDGLDARFAQALGRALGRMANVQGIGELVLGRDGRLSGRELLDALADGVMAEGVGVIDVGMVPTPLVYYACAELGTGSGVAVTGSHNPPEYNGFKMVMGGITLSGNDIQALARGMVERDGQPAAATKGARREHNIVPAYLDRVAGDVRLARPLRIAIDAGNGVAGAVAPELFERLGCEVTELYCQVDGRFPNHHPDPADPETLESLQALLAGGGYDLGLAFDGDGDRLGVVTPRGEIIWPDRQMMLFAQDVLSRNPGAPIIFDVKCSRLLGEVIEQAGGQPLMWKTGHSLIKAKLRETGAPLAGEMSGHVFFKERWYGFDDGLYTGARLLEIVSRAADCGAVLEALPQAISTPELKLAMPEGEHHILMARLQAAAARVFPDAKAIHTLDGVRVEYAEGFGLARPSNTTPVVVFRFEGNTDEALDAILADFRRAFAAFGIRAEELPF